MSVVRLRHRAPIVGDTIVIKGIGNAPGLGSMVASFCDGGCAGSEAL